MSFSRKAALALTGLAALAMPLAVAGAASASTSTGCTVTPLKPVFDHLNSSGDKVIRYDTKVSCDAGRSIEILDERRDQDNFSLDDFEGSKVYDLRFDSADTVTESASVRRTLTTGPRARTPRNDHRCRPPAAADGRQVLHLLLGQVEPDPVLDLDHRADRDGDFLASPEMPLPEQHVGHPVVIRIDLAAVHPPDLPVEGMDGLPAVDVCLAPRNNVLDNGLHRR